MLKGKSPTTNALEPRQIDSEKNRIIPACADRHHTLDATNPKTRRSRFITKKPAVFRQRV
jgi:hypothetical protein